MDIEIILARIAHAIGGEDWVIVIVGRALAFRHCISCVYFLMIRFEGVGIEKMVRGTNCMKEIESTAGKHEG